MAGMTEPSPADYAAAPPRPRPASLTDLFVSFTVLALQGFGGVLAVVQRELVEKKGWLTKEEFVEEWAVAQIMPGPNVINLSITLGARYFGWRGAVVAMAEMGGIRFLQGEDALTSYRFHTGSAQHFFCSRCGIYTHHQRRSDQNLYAVNVACLDGVSPFDFPDVPVMDGVNHTNDTGKPTRRAGTLRFIPAD